VAPALPRRRRKLASRTASEATRPMNSELDAAPSEWDLERFCDGSPTKRALGVVAGLKETMFLMGTSGRAIPSLFPMRDCDALPTNKVLDVVTGLEGMTIVLGTSE
jgi:hypothetical protein